MRNKKLISKIKASINITAPNASIILYGSQARGNSTKHSDIDILILIDNENLTFNDEQNIVNPIYDLEFESGKIISPLVLTKNDWELKHSITPFYKNIQKEGIIL